MSTVKFLYMLMIDLDNGDFDCNSWDIVEIICIFGELHLDSEESHRLWILARVQGQLTLNSRINVPVRLFFCLEFHLVCSYYLQRISLFQGVRLFGR